MPTSKEKERRVNAAIKRIDELERKRDKHRDALADTESKLKFEHSQLEWLRNMPVDDDGEDEGVHPDPGGLEHPDEPGDPVDPE